MSGDAPTAAPLPDGVGLHGTPGADEAANLRAGLTSLAGHDLACWCPLDQPCHADVLLDLANPPG